MNDISKLQQDIYKAKDLMQIQLLRSYRRECILADLAAGVDRLEYAIEKGETQYE